MYVYVLFRTCIVQNKFLFAIFCNTHLNMCNSFNYQQLWTKCVESMCTLYVFSASSFTCSSLHISFQFLWFFFFLCCRWLVESVRICNLGCDSFLSCFKFFFVLQLSSMEGFQFNQIQTKFFKNTKRKKWNKCKSLFVFCFCSSVRDALDVVAVFESYIACSDQLTIQIFALR